jgi:hypothetical protein
VARSVNATNGGLINRNIAQLSFRYAQSGGSVRTLPFQSNDVGNESAGGPAGAPVLAATSSERPPARDCHVPDHGTMPDHTHDAPDGHGDTRSWPLTVPFFAIVSQRSYVRAPQLTLFHRPANSADSGVGSVGVDDEVGTGSTATVVAGTGSTGGAGVVLLHALAQSAHASTPPMLRIVTTKLELP